ncbi:ISAs1 family transposase [Verminephrobacter eiseniae]|nr:ISAs1 family transposase [Verminephrobacter eiseniae]MCW5301646.1 ISAs1 family transposase [Verminephrobacter eiseniae]MCW8191629.1 ISAs1 family transposase [Verminephrobacter eiseniae]
MAEKDTIEELIEQLRQLKDPRVAGRTDHNLLDILVLALCAVMSGAQGWDDIEDWGRAHESWLRRYLKLRNGIPGHDTIRRVFEALSPSQLSACLSSWMAPSLPCGGRPGHCHQWQESARRGTSGLRVARTASGIGLRRRIWPDAGTIGLPRKVQRNHGHWRVAANAGARGSGCHHRCHRLPERDGRADRRRWWRLRACRQGQPTTSGPRLARLLWHARRARRPGQTDLRA